MNFKNPVIAASGTYGFGDCFCDFYDVSILGGISTKGLTLEARSGNSGIRIHETAGGIMNSIGLENPGIESYIREYGASIRNLDTAILANVGGSTLESYLSAITLLDESNKKQRLVDVIELNISCPNVKLGGMAYGMNPASAAEIVRKVRRLSSLPLVVKLSPNAPSIVDVALACESEGADGISLVNTFTGIDIDVKKRAPVFDNVVAGLSGPCILPMALKLLRDVCQKLSIPVIGMGGIQNHIDALKFIMAGAHLVQFGTASFIDPMAGKNIVEGLAAYLEEEGIESLDEIRGII